MEDEYGDDAKKMALLTTSYRHTKMKRVKEAGIGEDLPFTFFGWKHNELAVMAQMDYDLMNLDLYDRFDKSAKVCQALRQFWGIDELTMVAEGFLSYDPIATSGKSLRDAFIKNEGVSECITLSHAFTFDGEPKITVVAMPYSYAAKEVVWHKMVATPNEASRLFRESIFPALLIRVVSETADREVSPDMREEMAQQIANAGFQLYDFSDQDFSE